MSGDASISSTATRCVAEEPQQLPEFPTTERYKAVLDSSGMPVCATGGLGVVYRAFDSSLQAEVAIKRINSDLAEDAEWVSRFRLEARSLRKAQHQNIVRIFDLDEDEHGPWLAMEWIDGLNLKEVAEQRGCPFLPLEAVQVLLPIAEALEIVHRKGLVHRDVKHSNIMIRDSDQCPVLVDFGIVRATSEDVQNLHQTDAAPGSRPFMAPEQFTEPSAVDGRADIYALGATLAWMVTGRFRAQLTSMLLIPKEVRELVDRATQLAPSQRYSNMLEFAAAMRGCLRNLDSGGIDTTAVVSGGGDGSDLVGDAAVAALDCSIMPGPPQVTRSTTGGIRSFRWSDAAAADRHLQDLKSFGVPQLSECLQCVSIELQSPMFTDAIFSVLRQLPLLRNVTLIGCDVTGHGLPMLGECPRIRKLSLEGCPIDDAAVEQLVAATPQLLELSLRGTRVTERSVPSLTALKQLRKLDLTGARVTEDGKLRLRESFSGIDLLF